MNAREQPLLPGPSAGREGQTNSEGMKVVKLLLIRPVKMAREADFVSKSAIITTPGRCSTEMTPRSTADEIAKELGGTQYVFGLLEGDGVEGHADGGLAVAVDDAGAVDGKSKVDQ